MKLQLFKHYATAYNWAVDLHDRHQFTDAITWLRHAEEVASSEEGSVVGPERLARCMRLEAQCLRQIGDLEAARSSLVKANSVCYLVVSFCFLVLITITIKKGV